MSCRRRPRFSRRRRMPGPRVRATIYGADVRRRRRPVSVPLPAVSVDRSFSTARLAHLPWLQELPDPMTSAMWSSWVELNPKTAEQLGHRARRHRRSDVERRVAAGAGIHQPGPRARHHRDAGRPGAHELHALCVRPRSESGRDSRAVARAETGALAWAATRVKVARVGDPDGKLILFSARGELREKPLEGETR